MKKTVINELIQKIVSMYFSGKNQNNENWYGEWYSFRDGCMFAIQTSTGKSDSDMAKITRTIDNYIYNNEGGK